MTDDEAVDTFQRIVAQIIKRLVAEEEQRQQEEKEDKVCQSGNC